VIQVNDAQQEALTANMAILLKPCKVNFYECYNQAELVTLINKQVSEKAVKEKFFGSLYNVEQMMNEDYGYIIIDRSKRNEVFTKSKKRVDDLCKKNCLLFFEKENDEAKNETIKLYALKNNSSKINVNNFMDEVNSGFDERGYPYLGISLNKKGSKLFDNLTTKNINYYIAITLDEEVLLAPKVLNNITEGKLQISGNFTVREVEQLKNLIKLGDLPYKLEIASVEIKK
jgi:preprotein translocase subunit SecD